MGQCYSFVLQLSFIWQAKENTASRHGGKSTQKTQREEELPLNFWLLFLCVFFLFPLSLPYVNWAIQEDCLPEVLTPVFRPFFVLFSQVFPFFFFYPPPCCLLWRNIYLDFLPIFKTFLLI